MDKSGKGLNTRKIIAILLAVCFMVAALSDTSDARSKRRPRKPVEESLWLVLNIPAFRLTLYQDNKPVKAYKVAVGRSVYRTPRREWYTDRIIWNPSWSPPDSKWAENSGYVGPGPRNPMGNAKLKLSNGVYIHGTYKTRSLGRPASHACIRMDNQDVTELMWTIQSITGNNTPDRTVSFYQEKRRRSFGVRLNKTIHVSSIYETIEVAGDELLIHRDIYRLNKPTVEKALAKLEAAGYNPDTIDIALIEDAIRQSKKESIRVKIPNLVAKIARGSGKDKTAAND